MEPIQPSLTELFLENIVRNNPPTFRYLDIKAHPCFDWALEQRLLAETENARVFPCDGCDEGCPRDVRYFDDGNGGVRIRALCPEKKVTAGKDLTEDEVKRYKIEIKRFLQRLCEANGVGFNPADLNGKVVYLGTRDFDNSPVLFYIATRVNNKTVESELLKIIGQNPDIKKCALIPPRIKLSPEQESRFNGMNIFPYYVTANITDGKFRFRYYPFGSALKIRNFSFDELTEDGYYLILNPRNSDGCFLGSNIFPTEKQFRILVRLAENPSRGVSKNDLFDLIYEADKVEDVEELPDTQNPLESHLTRLRQLLDPHIKKEHDVPRGTNLIKSSRKYETVSLNLPPEKVIILPD